MDTLYSSACNGDIIGVATGLQNRKADDMNIAGFAAIHGAAEHCPMGKLNPIFRLLTSGQANFNIPAEDGSGSTPIFFACRHENPYTRLKVIDEQHIGADFTVVNRQGQVPLHYLFSNKARCVDKSEMCSAIQLLISKGANPKQKDIFGSTPLDWLKNYSTLPQTIKDAAIKQLDEVSKIRENIPKKTNGKILEKVVANLLSKRENDCTPTPMVSDNDQGISNDKTSESEAEEIENNNDSSPEIETTASAINVQSILQNIINTTPTPVSEDIQSLTTGEQPSNAINQILTASLRQFYLQQLQLQNQHYIKRVSDLLAQVPGSSNSSTSTENIDESTELRDLSGAIRIKAKLDGDRPSIYNRRISSEQKILPDGLVCTRVPARRWSKRDPDWEAFSFTCEYCPFFNDVRKYRRKAELVRHQALHFPEKARKFKCELCSYSATRNEYLKSHKANRHGIHEPRDIKRLKITQNPKTEFEHLIAISHFNSSTEGMLLNPENINPHFCEIGVKIEQVENESENIKIESMEAEESNSKQFAEIDMNEILPEETFNKKFSTT